MQGIAFDHKANFLLSYDTQSHASLTHAPLILSLKAHAMVPYDSIGAISLLLEIDQVVQVNYTVKQQQIVGELPHMSEIIQLAKNAATLLSSPPRIYSTSGNSVSLWPDQPEKVVETSYGTSGVQPPPEKAFVSQGASMTFLIAF